MSMFSQFCHWVGSLFSSKTNPQPEIRIPSTQPIVFSSPSKDGKNRIGLCVGINSYPDPRNNLAGCINDSLNFSTFLRNAKGYNKVILVQNDAATMENVTSTIKSCLAEKPDSFTYTNSSHGTLVPHSDGSVHEAICLYNSFLVNEDLRALLDQADDKTFITVFTDSCHSQGVLDKDFVKVPEKCIKSTMGARFMPYPDFSKIKINNKPSVGRKAFFEPIDMVEVLVSGCRSNEYSYDASFGGIPSGAFSYYSLNILKETPDISLNDFINKLNEFLPSARYPQTPVLQCADVNKSRIIFA